MPRKQSAPHNKLTREQRALAARGARAFFDLPFRQSSLARMLGVDVATVSQWRRRSCVGVRSFARVAFVPELRELITPAMLRPDLSMKEIRMALQDAAVWANEHKRQRALDIARSVESLRQERA